jgi:hypothetical protein
MRQGLSIAFVLAVVAGVCPGVAHAQDRKFKDLVVRELAEGETMRLEVAAGPLPYGSRLVVRTEQGDVLGSISSYGQPGPQDTHSGSFPVPPSDVVNKRLRVQVLIEAPGAMTRSATTEEIRSLTVVYRRKQ